MNNSIKLERGNRGYSTFGGQRTAFTSLDFGQLTPLMADEVLEKDSWRFSLSNKLEIAPMVCRSFNDIFYNQSAFFVSYSQLDKEFATIRSTKSTHYGATVPSLLSVRSIDILNYLIQASGLHFNIKASTGYVDSDTTFKVRQDMSSTALDSRLFDQVYTESSSGEDVAIFKIPVTPGQGDDFVNLELKKHLNSDATMSSADIKIVLHTQPTGDGYHYFFCLGLRYNKRGQFLRKIFDGLGYKMPLLYVDGKVDAWSAVTLLGSLTFCSTTDTSTTGTGVFKVHEGMPADAKLNAYPLLAYLKIFADYFTMSSVRDENPISLYLERVYDRNSLVLTPSTGILIASGLIASLQMISLQLFSDDVTRMTRSYFQNNNPFYTTPQNEGVAFKPVSDYLSTPPSQPGDILYSLRGDGSNLNQNSSFMPSDHISGNDLSQVAMNLVKVAHRYLLTTKLVGSHLASRLRAFFGITDPLDDAMRCIHIATNRIPIQINGQLIQSNTYNGADVDDDAGTRIGVPTGSGTTRFTFTNRHLLGIGITLNWLSVRTVYANRSPRYTLKTDKTDLYNGMFDGQGFAQEVGQMEINTDATDNAFNYVFGQEPLYEEYRKLSIDFMSGDILRLTGMKSYLIPRDFRNIPNSHLLYAEFSAVRSVRQSTDEFDDLWISKDGSDPVLVCSDVSVLATRNVQDSVHALGLPDGDMSVVLQSNIA